MHQGLFSTLEGCYDSGEGIPYHEHIGGFSTLEGTVSTIGHVQFI